MRSRPQTSTGCDLCEEALLAPRPATPCCFPPAVPAGVLLGSVQGGVVEVTNSFGVYHVKREGEVLVRRTAVLELLALHKKINSKEVVVGW